MNTFGPVLGLRIKSQHRLPRQSDSRDAPNISQWYGNWELIPLLRSHSQGQICTSYPPTNNTNRACLPLQQLLGKQMWQQPCTYYFSKTSTLSWRFRHTFSAYDSSLIKAHLSLTSDHPHYFELFRPYFLQNLHILFNPHQNKPFQASNTKYSKNKPKHPDAFNYANCDTQGIKFQR